MALQVEGVCPLLWVFDMPKALAFYRDVLGFAVVSSDRPGNECDWALLRQKDTEIMLNTLYEADERPPHPDPARVMAHGDTTLFFGCRDLEAAYMQLRLAGLDVTEPVIRGYGMKQLNLKDPDGYGLCFQWPAP